MMKEMVGPIAAVVATVLTACGSPHHPLAGEARLAAATPTSTPACVGLPSCATPPDAEGNSACYYSDGWQPTSSGTGIEVWYFHEPQSMSQPIKVTASVRKKDGSTESQDADIAAGQQVHRFEFATAAPSSVAGVFFQTTAGRCYVIGPSR